MKPYKNRILHDFLETPTNLFKKPYLAVSDPVYRFYASVGDSCACLCPLQLPPTIGGEAGSSN